MQRTSLGPKNTLALSVAFLFCACVLATGCTRPKQDKSSFNVSIVLPHEAQGHLKSTLANPTLAHVVLNVSGEGIPQNIFRVWDDDDGKTAPTTFDVDVPMGSNRLIQVLSVYRSDEGGMLFFYGDTLTNLEKTQETVEVKLAPLGLTGKTFGGDIAGRYFDSSGSGPTGIVETRYQPNGKPSMIITKSPILDGWFRLFGLSGIPFTYQMQNNGPIIFGKTGISFDSPLFAPSPNVVRMTTPTHRREQHNGETKTLVLEEPHIQIWGFFGTASALADRRVCLDNSAQTLTQIFHATNTSPLNVLYNSAPPANLFTASANTYVQGGLAPTSSLCASTLLTSESYSKILPITPLLRNGQGNDRASGFELPFRYNSELRVTTVQESIVTAKFLPGAPSHISAVKIFRKPNADSFHFRSEGIPCDAIEKGEFGFQFLANATISGDTVSFPLLASFSENGTGHALCPVVDGSMREVGVYIPSGSIFSGNSSTDGNSGGGGVIADRVLMSKLEAPTGVVASNTCFEMQFQLSSTNGGPAHHTAPVRVQVAGGNIAFFESWSACENYETSSIIANPEIPAGTAHYSLPARTSATGSVSLSLTYVATGGLTLVPPPPTDLSVKNRADRFISLRGPRMILADQCYLFGAHDQQFDGAPHSPTAPQTIAMEVRSPSNVKIENLLFLDSSCSTVATNFTMSSNTSQVHFYLKVPAGVAGPLRILADNATSTFVNDGELTLALGNGPNTVTKTVLMGPNEMPLNECQGFQLHLYNSFSTAVVPTNTTPVTVTTLSGTGNIFTDSICAVPLTQIPAGTHHHSVYAKFTAASGNNQGELQVTGTGITGNSSPVMLSANPLPIANLSTNIVTPNNQTYFALNVLNQNGQLGNYKYKFGLAANINCTVDDAYSAMLGANEPINLELNGQPDGTFKLCVLAKNTQNLWQELSAASQFTWVKDTTGPGVPIISSPAPGQTFLGKVVVQGTCTDGMLIQTWLNGTPIGAETPCSGGSYAHDVNLMGSGNAETIEVRHIDTLGNYDIASIPVFRNPILSLAAGANFTCAAFGNGQVKCWGANTSGQLGLNLSISGMNQGDAAGEMESLGVVDLDYPSFGNVVDIQAGYDFACALSQSNKIKCWGNNSYGQLGIGNSNSYGTSTNPMSSLLPVDLDSGVPLQIAVGNSHVCARLSSGQVKCWGKNNMGQLGLGHSNNVGNSGGMGPSLNSVNLGSGRTAVQIAAGGSHTCAVLDDDTVKCWGDNSSGQLGNGDTTSVGAIGGEVESPSNLVKISSIPLTGVSKLSLGSLHSCALMNDSTVKCWGSNSAGQLGNNTLVNAVSPVVHGSDSDVVTPMLFAKGSNTCFVSAANKFRCTGLNSTGQLGIGNSNNQKVPVTASTFDPTTAAVGLAHICSFANNELRCWGSGNSGALGNGGTANYGSAAGTSGTGAAVVPISPPPASAPL